MTRPVAQLLAYQRLTLVPVERVRMTFVVPPTRFAMTQASGVRVIEPGDLELCVGPSCAARETEAMLRFSVTGHVLTTADQPLQINDCRSTTGYCERRARRIQRLSCAVPATRASGNPGFCDMLSLLAPRRPHPDRSYPDRSYPDRSSLTRASAGSTVLATFWTPT